MEWFVLVIVIVLLVVTVWALARASGRADYERDMAKLAADIEELAREIRRRNARESDPNQRLRESWTRD